MTRENRKNEHVKLAIKPESIQPVTHFDNLSFVHNSIPEMAWKEVDLNSKFDDIVMNLPIYINAMTGGSNKTGEINAELADIASATGIAMAVGSQHAGLRNDSLVDTYRVVRKRNPKGIIFANIGADVSIEFALQAVDMFEANALQIHLNAPQEIVMPDGERNFKGWLHQIEQVIQAVHVPVIVKEVGFGMSTETLHLLNDIGVKYVDVSGRGGTNFVWIENQRRENKEYNYLKEWGQSTVISLLEAQEFIQSKKMTIFASGGIRNPLDIIKCLSLGAKGVGIGGPILRILKRDGKERVIEEINEWTLQLKSILTILGARTISDLQTCSIVITKDVREWCELRGIDVMRFAHRSL
ncbi:type 2 isopentenyl-diphosphate Delta-isomerase [Fictibacillus enclensis]|uniref:type 2 isopentenyl-diphosphate Delta-isomerase n=1 Tax=Fictibacillus enclensis TaxID=1017270 RepID=UPI0025A04CE2|nr:type 2 isopentenyl-diphosphate Delta-isomerase [Fictibacillus enclensis]MDM5197044.1 type 2 isopentenyl-diphosphate Delta-isomerase [Fictibacillus enclensis]